MSLFRKKFLIHGSIFLVLLIIIGGALIVVGKKIKTSAAEIETTRKQLYDWIVSLESFASIKTEYTTKAERYITVLNKRLPQKEELIDLRKDFKMLASTENVNADVVFDKETGGLGSHLGGISLNMTMSGESGNIIRFLKRLNELRYLVSIDTITFSRRESGIVDVNAHGEVFFKSK